MRPAPCRSCTCGSARWCAYHAGGKILVIAFNRNSIMCECVHAPPQLSTFITTTTVVLLPLPPLPHRHAQTHHHHTLPLSRSADQNIKTRTHQNTITVCCWHSRNHGTSSRTRTCSQKRILRRNSATPCSCPHSQRHPEKEKAAPTPTHVRKQTK